MNVLVVIGSALCVRFDLGEFTNLYAGECDYMAVGKDSVNRFIKWDYVATGHNEDIPFIRPVTNAKIISYEQFPDVSVIEPRHTWEGGSSALLGVRAAIKIGYTKIVLCGCPLHGPNPGHQGYDYNMFFKKWEEVKDEIIPFVRSMGGLTAELLGAPDEAWIHDRPD